MKRVSLPHGGVDRNLTDNRIVWSRPRRSLTVQTSNYQIERRRSCPFGDRFDVAYSDVAYGQKSNGSL